MNQESKWILTSKTFWVNVVLTGLLAFILSEYDVNRMIELFQNPEFTEVILLGPGAINIFARYFTGSPVGFLFKGSSGRSIFDSRTYRTNLLMAIPIYWYIGQEYLSGNLGELSLEAMIVLGLIPIINILIRATMTKTKVTLLPGILGRIV